MMRSTHIISATVLRTCKQSGMRRILKVCKEFVRVYAVNMHSHNYSRNNRNLINCLRRRFCTEFCIYTPFTNSVQQSVPRGLLKTQGHACNTSLLRQPPPLPPNVTILMNLSVMPMALTECIPRSISFLRHF